MTWSFTYYLLEARVMKICLHLLLLLSAIPGNGQTLKDLTRRKNIKFNQVNRTTHNTSVGSSIYKVTRETNGNIETNITTKEYCKVGKAICHQYIKRMVMFYEKVCVRLFNTCLSYVKFCWVTSTKKSLVSWNINEIMFFFFFLS